MNPLNIWIEERIGKFIVNTNSKNNLGTHNNIKYLKDSNGKEYCLKLFNSKNKWLTEKIIYLNIFNKNMKYIPEYYGAYSDEKQHALLISKLNGEPCYFRVNSIDNSDKENLYYDVGKIFKDVNSTNSGSYFGDISCESENKYYKESDYIKSRFEDYIEYLGLLSEELKKLFEDIYYKIDEVYNNTKPVIVNQDNNPRNWIINSENKLIGIIDFEYLNWGIEEETYLTVVLEEEYIQDAYCKGYGVSKNIFYNTRFLNYLFLLGCVMSIRSELYKNQKSKIMGEKLIQKYKEIKLKIF